MKFSLRLLYLYLFSFVGLIITITGAIKIIDLTLKTYVFKVEERSYYPEPARVVEGEETPVIQKDLVERQQQDQNNERKRDLSNSLAMILVGGPLYLYHWQTIKKEK